MIEVSHLTKTYESEAERRTVRTVGLDARAASKRHDLRAC